MSQQYSQAAGLALGGIIQRFLFCAGKNSIFSHQNYLLSTYAIA